jgi:spore coat protein H
MKRYALFLLTLSLLLTACDTSTIAQKENIRVDGVTASPEFFTFFDPAVYHELIIDVSKLNLDTLDMLMRRQYTKYNHYRISTYVKAKLTVRENGKDVLVMNDVGLRTHGNVFSRYLIETDGSTMNTLHWRLSFDEPFELEENTKAYKIRKQRTLFGLENLVLKWNRTAQGTPHASDPYINEAYAYSLYAKAGVPASKATLVHVIFRVNGRRIDQGVMTMIEPVDDAFLQKRFPNGQDNGNLYKVLWQMQPADFRKTDAILFGIKDEEDNYFPPYDIKTNRKTNTGQDLKDFIGDYQYQRNENLFNTLDQTLVWDNFYAFNAMNYLIGNPDDLRYNNNNLYVYFTSGTDPRLYFIPTDLDKGLGLTDWNPDGYEMRSVLPFDTFTSNGYLPVTPLLGKTILSNETKYTTAYHNELKRLIQDVFNYDDYLSAYRQAAKLYAADVGKNQTRSWLKPMGLPGAVAVYFCEQIYKVETLKSSLGQCGQ